MARPWHYKVRRRLYCYRLESLSMGGCVNHTALGQRLAALREQEALIVGSGNAVYALRAMRFDDSAAQPRAPRFNA